jgi:hypothetical protein
MTISLYENCLLRSNMPGVELSDLLQVLCEQAKVFVEPPLRLKVTVLCRDELVGYLRCDFDH